MELSEASRSFLLVALFEEKSPDTLSMYREALEDFIFIAGDKEFSLLIINDIKRFILSDINIYHGSKKLNRRYRTVQQFIKWCRAQKLCAPSFKASGVTIRRTLILDVP